METVKPKFEELFEQAISYPDPDMQERFAKLVGLDKEKEHLTKTLGLLVNPDGLTKWVKEYHPKAKKVIDIVLWKIQSN